MRRLSYVVPLRWPDGEHLAAMTAYLREIARVAEVIVADGSDAAAFDRHERAWGDFCTHVRTDGRYRSLNGKVGNVLTGASVASHDRIVVADDDVRYDAVTLRAVAKRLDEADVVVPQNYFDPMPWHAAWDAARSLINRSLWHDFPGTLAVRREALARGYDGGVLFENLELIRTVQARGGRVAVAPGLFVRRLPPTAARFWSQRVRQAYDELARPARLVSFLAVAPLAAAGGLRTVLVLAPTSVALAEIGRRRDGAASVFPARASLFAPAWLAERAICSWVALGIRLARGGVSYSGSRIRRAATPMRALRRRERERSAVTPARKASSPSPSSAEGASPSAARS